jgi:CHAD domain-containing protein
MTLSPQSTLEQEVKFRVSDAFAVPDLGGHGLRQIVSGSRSLDTTYWDTPDMRLARRGHTLRYRESDDGSKSQWTLKLGSPDDSPLLHRREVDREGAPDSPPDALVDALLGVTEGRTLTAVARMRSDQHQAWVEDAKGQRLLTVEDDRVAVIERNRLAGSFREVEVELADATQGRRALRRAIRVLRNAAAGEPDPTPKLVRALGPVARRETTTALRRKATVEELVRFIVRDGLDQLLLHDPAVRLDLGPEDVHQARIATRRLRANLRTLRPLLDRRTIDDLRNEIRWAGQSLGKVRDLDVLRASFADSLEGTNASDGAALIATVDAERAVAHRCLVEDMHTPRWQSMLHMLDAAAVLPPLRTTIAPTSEAGDAAHSLLRKSWRRLERRVAAAPESPTGWHEVRKAAKSTRYAAETLEPLLGPDTRPLARSAKRIQTQLGREQDIVIARAWLEDHGRAGPIGATAQKLAQQHYAGDAGTRPRQWKKLWKQARQSARIIV